MKRMYMMFLSLMTLLFITGCTQEQMVESKHVLPEGIPEFVQESNFDKINWDRKAVEFGDNRMIGNENKSGVIGAEKPSLYEPKWMWHLQGIENTENLTVVGYHKDSETVHRMITDRWTTELGGPNNGADAHIPSSVKVPKGGEWSILLYVNEQ